MGVQFDRSSIGSGHNSAFGFNMEGWFGKHLGVNYAILYQPSSSGHYYLYTGGGQAVAVYLIRKAIDDRNGLALAIPLGIVSFVLPESVSFRFPVNDKAQLGFFLAPYGFEYMKDRDTQEENYEISIELGVRVYLTPNDWLYLVPQVGVKSSYNEGQAKASYGLSVKFRLKEKSD